MFSPTIKHINRIINKIFLKLSIQAFIDILVAVKAVKVKRYRFYIFEKVLKNSFRATLLEY